jgi:hypothetical protein
MPRVNVTIPVDEAVARALDTPEQLERIGRLVTKIVRPYGDDDPLAILLEAMARKAAEAGLTDEEVDAELASHKAERRRGSRSCMPARST